MRLGCLPWPLAAKRGGEGAPFPPSLESMFRTRSRDRAAQHTKTLAAGRYSPPHDTLRLEIMPPLFQPLPQVWAARKGLYGPGRARASAGAAGARGRSEEESPG